MAKVVVNPLAVRALLRSEVVRLELERRAKAIADAAGPDHDARSSVGRARARATVATASVDAVLAESSDHTLTSALDAGR